MLLKPEKLQLAASKLSTYKVKSVTSTFCDTTLVNRDVHYCSAFCITPSWPPFSVSVRLIKNRLTEIFGWEHP